MCANRIMSFFLAPADSDKPFHEFQVITFPGNRQAEFLGRFEPRTVTLRSMHNNHSPIVSTLEPQESFLLFIKNSAYPKFMV